MCQFLQRESTPIQAHTPRSDLTLTPTLALALTPTDDERGHAVLLNTFVRGPQLKAACTNPVKRQPS